MHEQKVFSDNIEKAIGLLEDAGEQAEFLAKGGRAIYSSLGSLIRSSP